MEPWRHMFFADPAALTQTKHARCPQQFAINITFIWHDTAFVFSRNHARLRRLTCTWGRQRMLIL